MRNLKNDFINREIAYEKLLDYGFVKKKDHYILQKTIGNGCFQVIIEFSYNQQTAKVIELENGEEYLLADVKNVSGSFVQTIKEEYENILKDVFQKCTIQNPFHQRQTHLIIQYIKEHYHDELEYLWEKFPQDAVVRNKKNGKWYGVFMIIPENKLKSHSNTLTEIIDLRYEKGKTEEIIDNHSIFPGYHMNKNSWITVKLDNSINITKIYQLIDNSYQLSMKK